MWRGTEGDPWICLEWPWWPSVRQIQGGLETDGGINGEVKKG